MSGKGKHAEVASARNHLGATLQNLVDQKDDSQPSSDGEGSSHIDISSPRTLSSPSISPRKSLSKSNRKRKRKDDLGSLGSGQPHHTYVMKLFDRSVDLALFDENTPLYPVCRSWIRNDPQNKNIQPAPLPKSPSPVPDIKPGDDDEIDRYPDVHELPPPIKQEVSDIYMDMRIPSPVPQPREHIDIHSSGEAPPPEQLLLNHMARWKETRYKWRTSAFSNEMRYADSMIILKGMYERQCMKDG
ncbi:protein lin-37 homolog [Patella vulgata]|uniref:protein lin-37 homolog n=1 Tax=Patella vulgata TaxID=6465 RepID=UPI002180072A|nr:protein lin-37 homolog [Patella vulgata]